MGHWDGESMEVGDRVGCMGDGGGKWQRRNGREIGRKAVEGKYLERYLTIC